MAKIRFNPTWVAQVTINPESYKYSFPVTKDNNNNVLLAFDMDEINRVLNLFSVSEKELALDVGGIKPFAYLDGHSSSLPPSETHHVQLQGGGWGDTAILKDGYSVFDLDTSLTMPGPTGPEYISFQTFINRGFLGFGFVFGDDFVAEDIFIQMEGNFENPRPTPTSPVGGTTLNRHETIRFNWTHNSPFTQTKFELRYRVKGTSSWTTIQNNTNNRFYDLPAGTLSTNEYEWQVRTTSEYDFVSPWSLTQIFNAAETTPSPVFIKPTNGTTVEISDLHVEWTSVDQYQYEFELLDNNNNVVWSDARISTNQGLIVENILENNRSYRLRLRVNQQGNFFSPWVQITINVDYTQPARPILNIIPDQDNANLLIRVNNPPPTGTEPRPTHQALYKRELGGSWIKLANLLPNSEYIDYAVASGQQYEYRVTVYADNDTSITSNVFRGSVTFKDAILSLANDPQEFIKLRMQPTRNIAIGFSGTPMRFAGRKKPVTEFGETIELDATLDYIVTLNTLKQLEEMTYKQETLLYRDVRERLFYATIGNMRITDDIKQRDLFNVTMTLTEVDYKEGID